MEKLPSPTSNFLSTVNWLEASNVIRYSGFIEFTEPDHGVLHKKKTLVIAHDTDSSYELQLELR
jgi:hypothetical protein